MVAVHDGVLQKLTAFDSAEELILCEKMIINAIQFAVARRARGTGHRTAHARKCGADVVAKRGLAGPGRSRNHHHKRAYWKRRQSFDVLDLFADFFPTRFSG